MERERDGRPGESGREGYKTKTCNYFASNVPALQVRNSQAHIVGSGHSMNPGLGAPGTVWGWARTRPREEKSLIQNLTTPHRGLGTNKEEGRNNQQRRETN